MLAISSPLDPNLSGAEVCEAHMATSEIFQRVSATGLTPPRGQDSLMDGDGRRRSKHPGVWMALDGLTILVSAAFAAFYKFRTSPMGEVKGFWHGTLIPGRSMGILLALLCFYALALIVTSRRLHLYTPLRLNSSLHEQRLSVQACLYAGLLLTGTLYLIHAEDISRGVVLITIGAVEPAAAGLPAADLSPLRARRGYAQCADCGNRTRGARAAPSSGKPAPPGLHLQGLHRFSLRWLVFRNRFVCRAVCGVRSAFQA